MRHKYIFGLTVVVLILFAPALSSFEVQAQCKAFVKTGCLPNLSLYIHDGSYQAVVMSEGEEAEIYKTIFAGQQYRLHVCSDDNLPDIEFVISDIQRNILFDNRKNNYTKQWDFKSTTSQQIKVTIRVPKTKKGAQEKELTFGCVGILFGLLER